MISLLDRLGLALRRPSKPIATPQPVVPPKQQVAQTKPPAAHSFSDAEHFTAIERAKACPMRLSHKYRVILGDGAEDLIEADAYKLAGNGVDFYRARWELHQSQTFTKGQWILTYSWGRRYFPDKGETDGMDKFLSLNNINRVEKVEHP